MNLMDLPLPSRPAAGCKEGHVYVIEFSMGTVKIGQTTKPRNRMRQHYADAQKFGGNITRWWVSDPHAGWHQSEAALMGECFRIGRQLYGEYFADCDYDRVVDFAETLCSSAYSVTVEAPAGAVSWDSFDAWSRTNGVLRRVQFKGATAVSVRG